MRRILIGTVLASTLVGGAMAPAAPIRDRTPPFLYVVGTYEVSVAGAGGGAVAARMTVFTQHGNRFTIGIAEPTGNPALDWQGEGILKGNTGHYDWVFPDGKAGRTTIAIDADGVIQGQVRGSGLDWDYVARLVTDPSKFSRK